MATKTVLFYDIYIKPDIGPTSVPPAIVGGDASWNDNDPGTYTQTSSTTAPGGAGFTDVALGFVAGTPDIVSVVSWSLSVDVSGFVGEGALPLIRGQVSLWHPNESLDIVLGVLPQFDRSPGSSPQTFNFTDADYIPNGSVTFEEIFSNGFRVGLAPDNPPGDTNPSQYTLLTHRVRLTLVYATLAGIPRRTFPRDDGLAGGAPRNYPPSRAAQSSNRTSGYL